MSSQYLPAEPPPAEQPVPVPPAGSTHGRVPSKLVVFGRAFGVLWANGKARIGLVMIVLFVLMALLAPVAAPYAPNRADFPASEGVSGSHLLGTTGSGQDVLSQLLYGARVSLPVALVAGIFATLIAIVIGMIGGYLRGAVDETLGFITNLALVIPSLPLMIVLAAYIPGKGISVIVIVVVITGWATGARVMRSQTASLRSRDFVASALFSGERLPRIVFREILPNMTSLIAANFLAAATAAVLGEAGLEFLGLGNPSTVSWGTMLYWAQNNNALLTGQWVLIFAPGLCVALLATALSLVNFGVDALSNPRLRES
jgi:peptide/nickel transport system permease protein